jgi:hypothetical protein
MAAPAAGIADRPVALTAHPLQRAGAFALAALAGKRDPGQMDEADLRQATDVMRDELLGTTALVDSKAPGGFWLGASYLFWPNSAMNPNSRGKRPVPERAERLRSWRTLPSSGQTAGVPCALCGRSACGFYGKVDVPLGASTAHRNTTARGHEGLALCRGCLASFHALPYACAVSGGRAAVLHSWDDDFMAATVNVQVRRMRQNAAVAAGRFGDKRPYARQVAALHRIRAYEEKLTAGVDLLVFSNSNKEQTLDVHAMEQPLAEWLRSIRYAARFGNGWRYLARAHRSVKVPGQSALARNLFGRPRRVVGVAAEYLLQQASDLGMPPGETPDLGALCSDYVIKVLDMNETDADQIRALAASVAAVVEEDSSQFKGFAAACRKVSDLKRWLRRQAITRLQFTTKPDPFVSERQWRLLFDSGDDGFMSRDLLLIDTLAAVHALDPKWRSDDPGARSQPDDELDEETEEQDT